MTLFAHLDDFADRTAVIDDDGQSFSYRQLLDDADYLASQASPPALVLHVTQNSYGSVVGYVGCLRAGHVPILINHTASDTDISALIHRFRPAYVYVPRDLSALSEIRSAQFSDHGYWLYKTAYAYDTPSLDRNLGLLLSTSGSTGGGTFVRLSGRNITANTQDILNYLPITATDRSITTMPMSYTYGLSVINTHLSAGASIVMTEGSLVTPHFWNLMREDRVTNLNGVPFIYEMLKKLRFSRMDLPALTFMTQAGGKLPPALVAEFSQMCAAKNCQFFVMYGQTEATARIAFLPPDKLTRKPESIGDAIPGGRLHLIDGKGQEITAAGIAGELVYEGQNVSLGTAENHRDLSRGDDNKGVLSTGDIAVRDAEGDYAIVGRKKRALKLFGNRVNLDDLEQKLAEAGFVAACTGKDDALHITLEGEMASADARSWLLSNTTIPAKAIRVSRVATLPRTDAGKIRYHLLDKPEDVAS